MDKQKSLLIADDHALIRNGLRQVIESQNLFDVIEAKNGEEALTLIREKKPDIAILDIEMPLVSGFEVAKQVQKESLTIDLVFLTMFNDETIFNKAMDIGVKGYVLKENTVTEIMQCIQSVLAGKHYLSPAISDFLINRNKRLISTPTDKNGINFLTPTEKNILKQLALMKTNQELAEEFSVSIKTIQNHRNNICNKLGLHGAHALLKFAVEHSVQF
tara:strand:+ start:4992 stop:5642 length:651 start_codon:yes stop_codon:yes gene_type:complete